MSDLLPGARPPRQRLALAASLGLNVLLVAFIAAHHFLPPPHHGHGDHPPMPGILRHMADDLAAPDAAVLLQAIAAHQAALDSADHAARAAGDAARAALAAPQLDVASLRDKLEAAHAARSRVAAEIEAVLTQAAPALSPGGRARLAQEHR